MKKLILVVVAVFLITGLALAAGLADLSRQKGTPDLSGIKEAPAVSNKLPSGEEKVYEIPMTQMMPKADGSGEVEVAVSPIRVTKTQLTQGIVKANAKIAAAQKQVADLQAKLDKIIALEGTTTEK